jgi:hypothetical protein
MRRPASSLPDRNALTSKSFKVIAGTVQLTTGELQDPPARLAKTFKAYNVKGLSRSSSAKRTSQSSTPAFEEALVGAAFLRHSASSTTNIKSRPMSAKKGNTPKASPTSTKSRPSSAKKGNIPTHAFAHVDVEAIREELWDLKKNLAKEKCTVLECHNTISRLERGIQQQGKAGSSKNSGALIQKLKEQLRERLAENADLQKELSHLKNSSIFSDAKDVEAVKFECYFAAAKAFEAERLLARVVEAEGETKNGNTPTPHLASASNTHCEQRVARRIGAFVTSTGKPISSCFFNSIHPRIHLPLPCPLKIWACANLPHTPKQTFASTKKTGCQQLPRRLQCQQEKQRSATNYCRNTSRSTKKTTGYCVSN